MANVIRFTAGLLVGTAALCVPALAQDNTEAESRQQTVLVTGTPIRDSQAAAFEAKRQADNVVDVISADTIGRFPDQNLADSLARLPGLAVERDQGQARYINFRGAPFRYTAIAFDGITVPGAENGRVARFDSFPSVVTSAVEANKAVTPDMPGEAVAGYVNVRTFDPFSREGLTFSAEAGYGEQELGGGPVNKYNGRVSWSNDRFGAVAYGSYNRRVQNTDNRELDLSIDANGEYLVNQLDFRSYVVEREDNAWGGRVEYRPEGGPVERVFASTLYSQFIDNEERNQFVFQFGAGAAARRGALTPGMTGYEPLVIVRRLLEYGRYDNSTLSTAIGADASLAGWNVEGRIAYTQTENNLFLPIPFSIGTAAGSYDVTNLQSPKVETFAAFTQTPLNVNAITYSTNLGIIVDSKLDNEAVLAKFDAERDMTLFGRDSTVKFGLQYDARDASGYDFVQATVGFPTSVDIGDYATGVLWYSDFDNTIDATYYNNTALRDAWATAAGGLSATIPGNLLIGIEEKILSGYGMVTTRFEGGNIVYGVRVEQTDFTSDGPSLNISYNDSYLNILPSAHLNLDLTEDLKFRASASTGLSRPTYTEARASASVNVTTTPPSVNGGNPTLQAEQTRGIDLSLEYYFAPASLASVGTFYRHIDNVIYADSSTIDGGIYDPAAAGEAWQYTGFVNGGSGYMMGVEFAFTGNAADILPAPFDGLGVSANLTLLDSEFRTNANTRFGLPGTSDTILNASIFYEKFGLSARLNYQFRDAWLSTTENNSLAEYWDAQERVDASIRYVLPYEVRGSRLTLFANGNNLTDSIDVRYSDTPATPNQVEGYGRYWLVGLRLDY